MNRRSFLLNGSMLAVASFASPALFAQQASIEPFRRVGPNQEEKGKILVFFQFSCPACKVSHALIDRWGDSLPKNASFTFVPVVYPDMGVIASTRAWIAAGKLGRQAQKAFETVAYDVIQSGRHDPVQPGTWALVAREAGISHASYAQAWGQVVREDIERMAEIFMRSDIRETPSVLLDGQYVVTPDVVNGDEVMFTQLLNGMASAMLEGRRL